MIKTVLLIGIAMMLAYIGSHKQLSRLQMLFVALFLGTGGVFVVLPDLANRAAAAVNVGRGADLLLYFAVLSGVLVAANFYFRFKQIELALIAIVREMAIARPLHEAGGVPPNRGDKSC